MLGETGLSYILQNIQILLIISYSSLLLCPLSLSLITGTNLFAVLCPTFQILFTKFYHCMFFFLFTVTRKNLLTVAGKIGGSVILNVRLDDDDEVTFSGFNAPRYLVNSSAVCQVKYLSLNSGVGTQIFRQQSISSNFIVI